MVPNTTISVEKRYLLHSKMDNCIQCANNIIIMHAKMVSTVVFLYSFCNMKPIRFIYLFAIFLRFLTYRPPNSLPYYFIGSFKKQQHSFSLSVNNEICKFRLLGGFLFFYKIFVPFHFKSALVEKYALNVQ